MSWTMILTWLMTPLSGQTDHEIAMAVAWHGRLMVLGWNILLPTGILIARFCKITPRQDWPNRLDNKFWWRSHLFLQQTGVAISIVAVALIVMFGPVLPEGSVAIAHVYAGWLLLGIGVAQILSGRLRGTKGGPTADVFDGDHYLMTKRRILFERFHKSVGWASMALTFATTLLGLVLADAPRWMPLVILSWWIAIVAVFVICQRRRMCVDTYQAIWGPDPTLPGNQILPIGWGVTRGNASKP